MMPRYKTKERASSVCGALEARAKEKQKNAEQQQEFEEEENDPEKKDPEQEQQGLSSFHKAALKRSEKASKLFLTAEATEEEEGESYSDKVTRIMSEYSIDEAGAKEIVNTLISEEEHELQQQQIELQKQLDLERAKEKEEGQVVEEVKPELESVKTEE